MHSNGIRIVIADDHAMVLDGLTRVLHSEPGYRVIGVAGDGLEAIRVTRELQPDVLLLDLAMPRAAGLDVLRALTTPACGARPIVLTAGATREALVAAVELGARGIVLKESPSALLFDSIRCVMADRYWLGHDHVVDLVEALRRLRAQMDARPTHKRFNLTSRERQIVAAIVTGESNKEIAEEFSLSEETVKRHLSNIYDKLGVFSRLELAVFALNHGLAADRSHRDSLQ
jgi:two-component system nitrate/nitrite response regulator NarL